jgi:hypothetical protein
MIVVALAGEKRIDDFMHAADVFEPSKRLVYVYTFKTISENKNGLLLKYKKALELSGLKVVAVFELGNLEGAYIDKTVKMISNGHTWSLLSDFLKACDNFTKKEENGLVHV